MITHGYLNSFVYKLPKLESSNEVLQQMNKWVHEENGVLFITEKAWAGYGGTHL